MGTEVDVRNALQARARTAITAVSATLPIQYDNLAIPRPSDGKWAKANWLGCVRRALTLGANGLDIAVGVYQISLVYPSDDGSGNSRTHLHTVQSYFKIAQTLSSNGQVIHVKGTDMPAPLQVGNSYYEILSINWEAQLAR